jgi:anti-sigma factor RsiW
MPFLVRGSLGDRERRMVAAHLAGCQDCMAELKRVLSLRDVLRRQVSALPPAPDQMLEATLASLPTRESQPEPRQALRQFVLDSLIPAIADALVPGVVSSLIRYPLAVLRA